MILICASISNIDKERLWSYYILTWNLNLTPFMWLFMEQSQLYTLFNMKVIPEIGYRYSEEYNEYDQHFTDNPLYLHTLTNLSTTTNVKNKPKTYKQPVVSQTMVLIENKGNLKNCYYISKNKLRPHPSTETSHKVLVHLPGQI